MPLLEERRLARGFAPSSLCWQERQRDTEREYLRPLSKEGPIHLRFNSRLCCCYSGGGGTGALAIKEARRDQGDCAALAGDAISNEKYAHIWDGSSSSSASKVEAGKCRSQKAVQAANLALTMMDPRLLLSSVSRRGLVTLLADFSIYPFRIRIACIL